MSILHQRPVRSVDAYSQGRPCSSIRLAARSESKSNEQRESSRSSSFSRTSRYQPRRVPSLAGIPMTPAFTHSLSRLDSINGIPQWPPTMMSHSRLSKFGRFFSQEDERKRNSETFAWLPCTTPIFRPPIWRVRIVGSERIQSRCSPTILELANANHCSESRSQTLPWIKLHPQSPASFAS